MNRTLLPSAVYAATQNPGDESLPAGFTGGIFTLDITVVPGTVTVQLVIEGKDETSGKYYTLLQDTAQVAVGTRVLVIHLGVGAAAGGINGALSEELPPTFRARVVHSGGTNFTYSLGVSYLQ